MKDGTMVLIVSAPSYRDTIYIGYIKMEPPFFVLERALSIIYYVRDGVAGILDNPENVEKMSPTGKPHRVRFLMSNCAQIAEVDPEVWAPYLPGGEAGV